MSEKESRKREKQNRPRPLVQSEANEQAQDAKVNRIANNLVRTCRHQGFLRIKRSRSSSSFQNRKSDTEETSEVSSQGVNA